MGHVEGMLGLTCILGCIRMALEVGDILPAVDCMILQILASVGCMILHIVHFEAAASFAFLEDIVDGSEDTGDICPMMVLQVEAENVVLILEEKSMAEAHLTSDTEEFRRS